ncbi:MAG: NAD-dependent epimerase/dehydratase family protein [Ferrovibrio sp.]|uniref:NAD-dependent epimerase/dehydratase family protein n=1 Tax=Ferrovibrio sp. TaxID=1917215 RepID=UPI00261B959E|nr:NAD-dependent epimerase/dehydratase family protein [Ferrovibrio sp.]MCW0234762.1 NAD-dependent epimerase/dehydratase family protein [Ferrovibrio sp.]
MQPSSQPAATPRTAFVTGGSGFVGSRLITLLVSRGWQVKALARSRAAIEAVQRVGAMSIYGDLTDARALRSGLEGCEVVFHVAAHFKLWGPRAVFDQVNVEGTRALVEAAMATSGLRRVIGVSAAAVVMGDPEPMLEVDESLPLQTRDFAPYSSSKAEGERLLLAANSRRPGFETIAIRPPFIWGPDMPTLDHMVETVRAGRFQWVGGGGQAMSTCHVDNLCEALLLAVDRGRGGEAYFVSDGENGTLKNVISALLATRDIVPKARAVPFRLAWMMAGVMGAAWRMLGRSGEPPITRQMLRLIGKPFTISIAKARADLGYVPRVSFAEGIAIMGRGTHAVHAVPGLARPAPAPAGP